MVLEGATRTYLEVTYPLVNVYITMERSTMLLKGKSTISMAIFNSFNGNFRILKWRYCSVFLAIFCGDIPLHRPKK